jgi:ADP-L-glycero-D-manno-heptose 6-epimerase
MIIVTGAAGFIGSCLVRHLNQSGSTDLILVDDFSFPEKNKNLIEKQFFIKIERIQLFDWLADNNPEIDFVYHIGARTDTTEFNKEIFDELNELYSQKIWNYCTLKNIPLVYASSAATYGLGEFGYSDDHALISKLVPLNPYGDSKNNFDKWVLKQTKSPPFWAGLKFFNVYGPNEYHKGRMASVIFHTYNQIQEKGTMRLFRSHNTKYKDGEQLRDFIYVKDLIEVCLFLKDKLPESGIYNLGSGKARTFLDLATNTFHSLNLNPSISFVDTPEDIRDKYQYFTEADTTKLVSAGYTKPFHTLEEGVKDYVGNYLSGHFYY